MGFLLNPRPVRKRGRKEGTHIGEMDKMVDIDTANADKDG